MSAPIDASGRPTAPPSALVALPGTGSDADYVQRAFSPVAHALGIEMIAVDPAPDGIESGYRRALDDAARTHGLLLVAGVSIGACVALDWAVDDDRCVGVLAALPPWLDSADDAPASHSAYATAEAIDRLGLPGAIDAMVASSPSWLGAELSRSWTAIGAPLRRHLDEAGALRIPRAERIAALAVPLAITAAVDDPHPSRRGGPRVGDARAAQRGAHRHGGAMGGRRGRTRTSVPTGLAGCHRRCRAGIGSAALTATQSL